MMHNRETQPLLKASDVAWPEPSFRWRDLRDAAIGFELWPLHWWPWFDFSRDDDGFGGRATLTIGPLVLVLTYNAHDGPFGKPLP